MNNTEVGADDVEAVGRETVALLAHVDPPSAGAEREPAHEASAAAALRRLAVLVDAELGTDAEDLLLLYAREVVETWLAGHAALLLGEEGRQQLDTRQRLVQLLTDPRVASADVAPARLVTLLDLARRLDLHVYGTTEPPKAFQRHLASFFDEIDIGSAGPMPVARRPVARGPVGRPPGTTAASRTDVLRVCLWVVLFLARYYFDATGDAELARQSYELFERLRDATAAFYEQRALR